MKEFLSRFMKDFLSKVLPWLLAFGFIYTLLTAGKDLSYVKIGDFDTPKILRDGNLSMFKSAIISNSILKGLLIILISVSLIAIITLIFKNKEINAIVKVSIIGSVFIIFMISYYYRNIPYASNDIYDTIETKAEDYITDFTDNEYDKMITDYVVNRNMKVFASRNLYSQAMERTIKEYGQIKEIEDPINVYINEDYTVICYPIIHGDDQLVYYNIAFNSRNEISGLFTTLILLDRDNNVSPF